jgi:lysozyme
MNGIDVSSYQADLDVSTVTADFVIVKATQGTQYVNPYCDTHIQQALAAGKKIGVYHYADGGNAIVEADHFVDNCVNYIRKAVFVLDWEGTGTEYTKWALQFLQRVEARIGYKPTIYMSETVENNNDWSAVAAGDYGLWLAKYWDMNVDYNYDMTNAGPGPVAKYWQTPYIWQWTSSGRLNGYGGNLDCNKAYITPEQWDAYAGVQTAPQPEPTTTTTELPVSTTTTTTLDVETTTTTTDTTTPPPTFTTTEVYPSEPSLTPPPKLWIIALIAGVLAMLVVLFH